jgi:hypothetical protein
MMEIRFVKVPKHELAKEIYVPKFEKIKKEIKYEHLEIKTEDTH